MTTAKLLLVLALQPHLAAAALRGDGDGSSSAAATAASPSSFAGLHAELSAKPPAPDLLAALFPLLDGDGDGAVSQADLTGALLLGAAKMRAHDDGKLRAARTEQLRPLFARLDANGDGRLGAPASERDAPAYAAQRAEFGAAKFDRLWDYADADGDGALNLPEFVTQHFPELGPFHEHDAVAAWGGVLRGAREGGVGVGAAHAADGAKTATAEKAKKGADGGGGGSSSGGGADRNAHAYSHHRAADDLALSAKTTTAKLTAKDWEAHHRAKWAAGHAPAYHLPTDRTGEDSRILTQILATQAAAFAAADAVAGGGDGDGRLDAGELAALHRTQVLTLTSAFLLLVLTRD